MYPGYRLRRAAHGLPALYYRAPDGWALTDSALEDLSVCLRARAESAVQAGSPPQPVGEAFLTRSTRLFASAWLCGKTQGPIQELAALLPAESYAEQLAAYQQLCTSALENYETLLPGCSYAGRATTPLWQEQVVFSVRLYLYALRGAVRFCTRGSSFWIRTGRTAFAPWAVRRMILVPWQLCCSQKLGSGPAFAAIPCWTAH